MSPDIRSQKGGRLVFKSGSPEGFANSSYISRSKMTGRMLYFLRRGIIQKKYAYTHLQTTDFRVYEYELSKNKVSILKYIKTVEYPVVVPSYSYGIGGGLAADIAKNEIYQVRAERNKGIYCEARDLKTLELKRYRLWTGDELEDPKFDSCWSVDVGNNKLFAIGGYGNSLPKVLYCFNAVEEDFPILWKYDLRTVVDESEGAGEIGEIANFIKLRDVRYLNNKVFVGVSLGRWWDYLIWRWQRQKVVVYTDDGVLENVYNLTDWELMGGSSYDAGDDMALNFIDVDEDYLYVQIYRRYLDYVEVNKYTLEKRVLLTGELVKEIVIDAFTLGMENDKDYLYFHLGNNLYVYKKENLSLIETHFVQGGYRNMGFLSDWWVK